MLKTLREAFAQKDLRRKILMTLGLMMLYCVGLFLPIPGIDPSVFSSAVNNSGSNSFLSLLSSLTGGALSKGAWFAIGVSPYITSSIVVQLLSVALPSLQRLSKQGSDGRKKIAVITRYVALVLAVVQSIAIVISINTVSSKTLLWESAPDFLVQVMVVISLVAGTMLTVWLGDKITEIGVANGMSMLVFVGILTSGVTAFTNSVVKIFTEGIDAIVTPIIFILLLVFIFAFIVMFDLAERRIPVTYAKQVKGNKMYGGQSTNIPIKLNATGVMPIIFATALVNFPQLVMQMLLSFNNKGVINAYDWYQTYMGTGTWINIVVTSLLILGFSYFYATLMFNPEEVALQIQRNGGFILGYRPGKPTMDYLRKVSHRITFFGAVFLMLVAMIPSLLFTNIPAISGDALTTAFTSIGMLVIVSVALEFDKSIQNQMLMKQYKGFLK
ncbi:MAG: preprotein translocase subunit SecY [Eubacteriales bacterium]|nr:preprotein translocase subunit SecY [Eubacteriales bacterium]